MTDAFVTQGKLIPNTDEWLRWRHQGLGGSDIVAILGKSRFKTPMDVWTEKTTPFEDLPPDEPGYIQQKGHDLETRARSEFELSRMKKYPPLLAEYGEDRRLRASLDGYSEGEVWECKFYGRAKFLSVKAGFVPEEAYPQIQWGMLVTGATKAVLVIVNDKTNDASIPAGEIRMAEVAVVRCQEYIDGTLLPTAMRFLACVEYRVPFRIDPDGVLVVEDLDTMKTAARYHTLLPFIKEMDAVKKKLFKASEKMGSFYSNGLKVLTSRSETTVVPDYKKACEKLDIDMGEFTVEKKGRLSRRIVC